MLVFKRFASFIILSMACSGFAFELSPSQITELSQDPFWLRLVHYKKSFAGRAYESQADGAQFFLASDGKHSPSIELQATLQALQSENKKLLGIPLTNEKIELTALCQFPARAKWLHHELKERYQLNLSLEALQNCVEYNKFIQRLRARSVTLVFSSYYMNNPSSTFGHSLIRLNRQKHSERNEKSTELLDIGVNYAANATTENPFFYAVLGMAGGFPGTFTVMPYYYKVREYNDYESRDLWEYDLALNDAEVERFVDHLWELSFTTFDYFYITENCSYHMLTLLEVAAPRLDLVNQLPFWIIPGETIDAIKNQSGLIERIVYRPSVHRQFKERLALLSKPEFESFETWRGGKQNWREGLDSRSLARVLDVGLDYFDYKFAKELLLDRKGPKVGEKNIWLLERSELPMVPALKVETPEQESPDKAHRSGRGGLRLMERSQWDISWRFALHDFIDPIAGYPDYAQIDFFSFGWGYSRALSQSPFFDRLHLVGITSLAPMGRFEQEASWRVFFGWEREPELSQLGTPAFFKSGVGGTYRFESAGLRGLTVYSLLQGKISHTFESLQRENLFFSVGPLFGARWAWSSRANFLFEAINESVLSPRRVQRPSWSLIQTYTAGDTKKLILELRWSKPVTESASVGSIGAYYYF